MPGVGIVFARMLGQDFSSGERCLLQLARMIWGGRTEYNIIDILRPLDHQSLQVAIEAIELRLATQFDWYRDKCCRIPSIAAPVRDAIASSAPTIRIWRAKHPQWLVHGTHGDAHSRQPFLVRRLRNPETDLACGFSRRELMSCTPHLGWRASLRREVSVNVQPYPQRCRE